MVIKVGSNHRILPQRIARHLRKQNGKSTGKNADLMSGFQTSNSEMDEDNHSDALE